jgi:cytochrome c oxidase assembly factor CtaG
MLAGVPRALRAPFARVMNATHVLRVWRWCARPLQAAVAHSMVVVLWHVPALYDRSVESSAVHATQHLTFLVTALAFWESVLAPRHRYHALAAPLGLFAVATVTGGLGALLTLSPAPWYAPYEHVAGGPVSPLEDQQLAGLIMWMPGTVAYLIAALALMRPWLSNRLSVRKFDEFETGG